MTFEEIFKNVPGASDFVASMPKIWPISLLQDIYAPFGALHLVGLALMGGAVILLNLRLMGAGIKEGWHCRANSGDLGFTFHDLITFAQLRAGQCAGNRGRDRPGLAHAGDPFGGNRDFHRCGLHSHQINQDWFRP